MLFVCSVTWLFLLGCQYQYKWLTGKTVSKMIYNVLIGTLNSSIPYHTIGPKSRTGRPKIGTEVAHVSCVTWTPLSRSKVTRPLYSPRRQRVRQLQQWAWERIGRGNLLLRCRSGRLGGALGSTEGGEERGYIASSARLQLGNTCTLLLTSYREVQSSGTFSYYW